MSREHEDRTTEEGAQPNGQAFVADQRQRSGAKNPRVRTCVGCGERVEMTARASLVRLILGPEGEVAVDSGDGLHPSIEGYRAMAAAVPLELLR